MYLLSGRSNILQYKKRLTLGLQLLAVKPFTDTPVRYVVQVVEYVGVAAGQQPPHENLKITYFINTGIS
jgi:hypothetical protein